MTTKINNEYKDSLFKIIFGDYKENALALYNALNGTDYDDPDELTVTTLENAVYIGRTNDVSFIVDNVLNLYEHQSTYNPNMPLRGLEYFSEMYSNYIEEGVGGRKRLYGEKLVRIPTPRFYVFYNGDREVPEQMEFRLSNAYDDDGDVEVIAHMININRGSGTYVLVKCKPMADYSELIGRIKENRRVGMSKEDAVEQAIESCIEEGIMAELLKKEKSRAISPLLTALTDQEIEELHKEQIEEGIEQGIEQGIDLKDRLFKLMSEDGRLDDYAKSVDDREYFESLLIEYGLKKEE